VKRTRYTSLSEINVTNLVDVTLVLLIIFMITAPLLQTGIEVELPKTQAARLNVREGVVVSISKDGSIFIDDIKVTRKNFAATLLKNYESAGQKSVLLRADKSVSYGKVMDVMGQIKRAGIHNIGLVVEPLDES